MRCAGGRYSARAGRYGSLLSGDRRRESILLKEGVVLHSSRSLTHRSLRSALSDAQDRPAARATFQLGPFRL